MPPHASSLRKLAVVLAVLLLAGWSGAAVTNLFPNGDFDSPAGTNAPWNEVFGGGTTTYGYPTSGGNPGGFGVITNASGWGIWVGQTSPTAGYSLAPLGLVAGGNYNFVMDLKNFSGTGIGKLKIECWAGGVRIDEGPEILASAQSGSWATYTFNRTLVPGTTDIMIVPVAGAGSVVGYDNIGVVVPNTPLAVAITSPVNGATVAENFTINAIATVSPGTVTNVSFYDGAVLLGSDTTPPYSQAVTGAAPGAHALRAVARDHTGNSVTSSVVNITVASIPPVPGWQLVWNDEFTQPDGSSPDPAKWGYNLGGGGWGNGELQSYTSRTNNARIENDQLVIEARAETYTGADNITRQYTSARLLTQNKWNWTYGRFEARIKVPRTQGLWPAFWMLGTNISGPGAVGWPACGEIDIMEHIGREPKKVYGTIHGPGYSGGSAVGGSYTFGPDVAADFRIFAVEWETNVIRWYVDGIQYFSATPASLGGNTWVFDHGHFLLLNVAVGGNWPGDPDGTTVMPQKMLVDYVRVYAKATIPPTVPAAPTGLRASPGNGRVYLSWDAVSGATGYHVKRAPNTGGPYTTIASPAANNFTDTGAANCASYFYVVSATNSAGAGTNSSEQAASLGAFALAVNSGGGAAGQFVADAYVTGGTIGAVSPATIDTSGLVAPAPPAVYQAERFGNFTYTFTGLIPGATYKVRLHSAETYWTAVGQRRFNVAINGTPVLTNFDIIAVAGAPNKAVISEFNAIATGGQIAVQYSTVTDNARASGIEILLPQPAAPAAGNNGPLWTGMTLNLTASTVPDATYSWTGPNGFSSTNQNPVLPGVTTSDAGLYSVTAIAGGCSSPPASTLVAINPPASVNIQPGADSIILSWPGGTLQSATNVVGPWHDVSGATSPRTNPAAAAQEFYRIKLQ